MPTRTSFFLNTARFRIALLAPGSVAAMLASGCSSHPFPAAHNQASPDEQAPLVRLADPITLFLAGDEEGSIERLRSALKGEAPLLPPALRMTEPEFAARYAQLPEPERSEWQQILLEQHQPIRSFTRALLSRIEAADAAGRTVEARHLRDLLRRFGEDLRSDSYTALTNTYGRGIEQALARSESSPP